MTRECQRTNSSNARELRARELPDRIRVDATQSVNRPAQTMRHETKAHRREGSAIGMTLRGEHWREKHGIRSERLGPGRCCQRMGGRGHEPIRATRTPAEQCAGPCFRKMHAVGTRARGEFGIIGDREKEPLRPRDAGQRNSQRFATRTLSRPQDDETALRQVARGTARIGQALIVRHQHERRQFALVEPCREPC